MSTVVSKERAAGYTKTVIKTPEGKSKRVIDSNDEIANELRGKTMEELHGIALAHGFKEQWDTKWSKLNNGLCRMSLGNSMRGARRRAVEQKAVAEAKAKAEHDKKLAEAKEAKDKVAEHKHEHEHASTTA